MTISSTNRKAGPYPGNDVAVAFPFAFKVFKAADVFVVRADAVGDETVLALTTNYTVALNADQNATPGGTVTLPAALASGYSLTISSSLDYLQPTDLTNNGGFFPKVINDALDRLTIMVQQVVEQLGRSLKLAISVPPGVKVTLPVPVPYQVLGWDSSGTQIVNADPTYATALSSDLASTAAGKGASLVGFIQEGPGAVATTVQDELRVRVNFKQFGLLGDGSDETTKLQNALNAAAGKVLQLEAGKTYGYTFLTIKAGTTIVSNGSTFNRLAASTSHGITIEGGVYIDSLVITTPGGVGGDKAVAIRGSNVKIGIISIIAAAQGNSSSVNWAVEVESSPVGTLLSRIVIDDFYCKYFSTAFFAKNATLCRINNAIVDYYRLSFYLKDVARSAFKNVTCRNLGAASNGTSGENGLLVESSLSSGSSHELLFENWYVADSGEHAYRLGGQKAIYDVWFKNCVSEKSGSSILNGDLSGGEWHGGCGFKVLGGNTTITEFHENIHFDNCGVIDCNITYGTYPAGHGINNFTPWLIVMAKNVHISDCWTKAKAQSYVSRYAILFTAVDGIYLNGNSVRDAELSAIKPYQETPISGYPGSDLPIKNLVVDGGFYEVNTATIGNGIPFYMSENANYANENWTVKSAVFKGGSSALRIESVGSGSYSNLNFEFTYVGTIVDDSTYATATITGGAATGALVNAVAPWRPTAGSPAVANGSTWASPNDGEIRTRTDGVWRKGPKTYSVSIANDSFAIITPPAADVGVIAVSGSGTATHIFGWYRATSSPASLKYAGAATAVMVNTALTGTTGTVGNVTIGIQNNAIYIENRNGSTNTFKVSFL